MLVACRLAGLSALETHYAGVKARAQCGHSRSGGRQFAGSRARSTMKGPAPCDDAGNRGCGAGQCLASRAKEVTWLTRANRALMGGYCARDPRLYGCGMGTQLSRWGQVGGPFRCRGHYPSRNMLQSGCWVVCGVCVWSGFSSSARSSDDEGAGSGRVPPVPSMLAAGKERAARHVGIVGNAPSAPHTTGQRAKPPFRTSSQWRTPRYSTACDRACSFRPKA